MMLYISMKFHENVLNCFRVTERTRNYHCRISKGNNSKTIQTRVTVLVYCKSSDDVYFSKRFHENILKGFQVMERHEMTIVKFQREITTKLYRHEIQFSCSARCLMMLYISMMIYDNILHGFQVIEQTQNYHSLISKGSNSKNV